MMVSTIEGSLSLHRFGVGARAGELAQVPRDPRAALKGQLALPSAALMNQANLPASSAAARALARARLEKKRTAEASDPPQNDAAKLVAIPWAKMDLADALASGSPGAIRRAVYQSEVLARLRHGATTSAGFVERLVLFWTNHFAVSVDKGPVHVLAGAMEREAIRPHVLGKFTDLLKAAERHPAMVLFLDNQQSVGPHSPAGVRTGRGLNENLAREMLELHTLGVDGGYTQEDITNLAKLLTGWGWTPPRSDREDAGQVAFFPGRHEPGTIVVLGRTYAQDGPAQADALLDDLARHPATARHLARKLAMHFIADDPPQAAVGRIEAAFRDSDGDLANVASAIVDCPEAWDPVPRKIKTPYEFVVSAIRMEPRILDHRELLRGAFAALGQRPFAPPSPKGFEDDGTAWLAPHSFKERVEWASLVADRFPPSTNPAGLADDLFGPLLSRETRLAVAQAASGTQALTLLLMSPEFQRR
jgi:uncharacterized protein (DUF1800 family)